MKTHGYEWLEGTAFWESPTLQDPITQDNKKALDDFEGGKKKQRKGV
jgi:3D-(3,5/4)-trihydroxycyclohexane-1,2-dione acylhydrolase (decyclizing)